MKVTDHMAVICSITAEIWLIGRPVEPGRLARNCLPELHHSTIKRGNYRALHRRRLSTDLPITICLHRPM